MLTLEDLEVLCCPSCKGVLQHNGQTLTCSACRSAVPIIDGIPRFVGRNPDYNAMWDYKWTVLDNGQGFNYQILKRDSPAYRLHNLFRFFETERILFEGLAEGHGRAADVGCGTGQYSISLLEKGARRVYAIDLTRGVDIGQRVVRHLYPQYADKIVFIQADARQIPLRSNSMDLSMALGSIHHSGFLETCISEVVRITQVRKPFFIWIYAKPLVRFGDDYRSWRGWLRMNRGLAYLSYVELIFNIVKRLPESVRMPLLRIFASDFYYWLRRLPFIGRFFVYFMPGVGEHPDKGYRLINLYDAYSPAYSEASDEGDVIRWSQLFKFKLLSFSTWRLGFIGSKTEEKA